MVTVAFGMCRISLLFDKQKKDHFSNLFFGIKGSHKHNNIKTLN